jgi:hypothetical protein
MPFVKQPQAELDAIVTFAQVERRSRYLTQAVATHPQAKQTKRSGLIPKTSTKLTF